MGGVGGGEDLRYTTPSGIVSQPWLWWLVFFWAGRTGRAFRTDDPKKRGGRRKKRGGEEGRKGSPFSNALYVEFLSPESLSPISSDMKHCRLSLHQDRRPKNC